VKAFSKYSLPNFDLIFSAHFSAVPPSYSYSKIFVLSLSVDH
jgi:hypothetical protein